MSSLLQISSFIFPGRRGGHVRADSAGGPPGNGFPQSFQQSLQLGLSEAPTSATAWSAG